MTRAIEASILKNDARLSDFFARHKCGWWTILQAKETGMRNVIRGGDEAEVEDLEAAQQRH